MQLVNRQKSNVENIRHSMAGTMIEAEVSSAAVKAVQPSPLSVVPR